MTFMRDIARVPPGVDFCPDYRDCHSTMKKKGILCSRLLLFSLLLVLLIVMLLKISFHAPMLKIGLQFSTDKMAITTVQVFRAYIIINIHVFREPFHPFKCYETYSDWSEKIMLCV